MRPVLGLAIIGLVGSSAIGCGGSKGPARQAISGRVTLDGQPLTAGMVTLSPTNGGEPVVTGILGADGTFTLDRADGPLPGAHRVTIWAPQPTGRKVRDPDDPTQFIEETRESIPARYNVNSELTAPVREDASNDFNFELRDDRLARGARR